MTFSAPLRLFSDEGEMDGMLLGNILLRNARDPGLSRKTAIIFGNRALTYRELNEESNRVANGLLDRGVRKGDRIGMLSRNSEVYVAVYFALAKLGAIMVPVNFWYRSREIRYTLRQSAARGLIYQNRFADVVAGVGDLTRAGMDADRRRQSRQPAGGRGGRIPVRASPESNSTRTIRISSCTRVARRGFPRVRFSRTRAIIFRPSLSPCRQEEKVTTSASSSTRSSTPAGRTAWCFHTF